MDAAAFHALALVEVDAVHRLAFHLSRSHHEAEDLVQETFLRALRSADGFVLGEQGIRPWLFKILHNVLHTQRSQERRTRAALRRVEETAGPTSSANLGASDLARHVPGVVNWEGTDERLCQAIRRLPVAHRTIFLLSAVEDLKYREIADIVGVPVGTVMSRLYRARVVLAKQLRELAAEQNLRGARTEPPDQTRTSRT